MKAYGYEKCITEDEIWLALKTVGTDKTLRIDGFPNEVYLRLSDIFVRFLVTVYNNWIQRFTLSIEKFLRKNKHGRNGINNFRFLKMVNTNFKNFGENLGRPFSDCPA